MIENINDILQKPQCSAAHKFIKSGSKKEQLQWWKLYKKTFTGAPPPTTDHIQIIKECYERELKDNGIDDMTQNALLFMADDSPVFEAFKMLGAFFDFNAARRKRNDLLIRQPPISKEQRDKTNDITPSKKQPEVRYNQFNNHLLQEFNKQRELTKAIKENIQRAAVLLELYPFRHEIIEAMQAPGAKEKESKTDAHVLIPQIAKRRSGAKNGTDYQKIVDALTLWHETENPIQKNIAQKIGVTPQSLSEWKKELKEKMK